ncbi:hypothetical protein BC835DRAFT_1423056 [Cytidiella melzeri]|nr:hypothetical protein BC835DRAFT_1423056 [Cytidiella melzeri]
MTGKRKAPAIQAGSDLDSGQSHSSKRSSEALKQPSQPARPALRRERRKTKKQLDIDHAELLELCKKLENKNKALLRAQKEGPSQQQATRLSSTGAGIKANQQQEDVASNSNDEQNTNEPGDNDASWPPKEEDNDIVSYKSQFHSRGVVDVAQPVKQLKLCANNPKSVRTRTFVAPSCPPATPYKEPALERSSQHESLARRHSKLLPRGHSRSQSRGAHRFRLAVARRCSWDPVNRLSLSLICRRSLVSRSGVPLWSSFFVAVASSFTTNFSSSVFILLLLLYATAVLSSFIATPSYLLALTLTSSLVAITLTLSLIAILSSLNDALSPLSPICTSQHGT